MNLPTSIVGVVREDQVDDLSLLILSSRARNSLLLDSIHLSTSSDVKKWSLIINQACPVDARGQKDDICNVRDGGKLASRSELARTHQSRDVVTEEVCFSPSGTVE